MLSFCEVTSSNSIEPSLFLASSIAHWMFLTYDTVGTGLLCAPPVQSCTPSHQPLRLMVSLPTLTDFPGWKPWSLWNGHWSLVFDKKNFNFSVLVLKFIFWTSSQASQNLEESNSLQGGSSSSVEGPRRSLSEISIVNPHH